MNSTHLVQRAHELRQRALDTTETTIFRILNGEGDGLPGLYVDRYGDFAVSLEPRDVEIGLRRDVYAALMNVWGLRGVYEKGAAKQGFHPESSEAERPILGEAAPCEYPVMENGMVLLARLGEGFRPGVYPDQRENRRYLGSLMRSESVLNLFSYTGAFSVWAGLCGARETVSVDLSKRALEWSKCNFLANQLDISVHRHVKADVFDYLGLAQRKGFRFGLVILDPPTFSTGPRRRFRARRDWPRLISAATKVLNNGGRLGISCNTHDISQKEILSMVAQGISGKRSRIVKPEAVLGLPPDFPVPPNAPWMNYLKFVVTRPISLR